MNINQAITAAFAEFELKHGKDTQLDEGDKFATIFNNCVLIIESKDNELTVNFIGGKPYQVDANVDIYKS